MSKATHPTTKTKAVVGRLVDEWRRSSVDARRLATVSKFGSRQGYEAATCMLAQLAT